MKKIFLLLVISFAAAMQGSFAAMQGATEPNSQRWEDEKSRARTFYFAGYLSEALAKAYNSRQYGSPVFHYTDNVPEILPGGPYKRFLFAGQVGNNFSPEAKEAQDSVICPEAVEVKDSNNQYHQSDVLIAGTCDSGICDKFKKHYRRDLVSLAAQGKLDKAHPYSDTPVLELQKGPNDEVRFVDKGNLANISNRDPFERLKFQLLENCTICPFFTLMKSQGQHKPVGAVVENTQGTDPKKVCEALLESTTISTVGSIVDEAKKYSAANSERNK